LYRAFSQGFYNARNAAQREFAELALRCAEQEKEMLWRLPFADFHLAQIESACADIANIHSGEGMAGPSTVAAFLAKFVKQPYKNWLHVDLSGSYQMSATSLCTVAAKGHEVRTISKILLS
jgi:PepB aminopeptidase